MRELCPKASLSRHAERVSGEGEPDAPTAGSPRLRQQETEAGARTVHLDVQATASGDAGRPPRPDPPRRRPARSRPASTSRSKDVASCAGRGPAPRGPRDRAAPPGAAGETRSREAVRAPSRSPRRGAARAGRCCVRAKRKRLTGAASRITAQAARPTAASPPKPFLDLLHPAVQHRERLLADGVEGRPGGSCSARSRPGRSPRAAHARSRCRPRARPRRPLRRRSAG